MQRDCTRTGLRSALRVRALPATIQPDTGSFHACSFTDTRPSSWSESPSPASSNDDHYLLFIGCFASWLYKRLFGLSAHHDARAQPLVYAFASSPPEVHWGATGVVPDPADASLGLLIAGGPWRVGYTPPNHFLHVLAWMPTMPKSLSVCLF